MKFSWIVVAVAALVAAIGRHRGRSRCWRAPSTRPRRHCVDRPYQFSWSFLLPGSPTPQPNGCAPPVYHYGEFIGQDPDRNIRLQLKRDPATGYAPL